jgi:cytochrome oxidase Cu insertion factor (SCO1/SenC/PrrC family)
MTNQNPEVTAKKVSRGRRTLLLLAGLFFGPLAGAWIYFFVADPETFQAEVNKGQLIDPPRPVSVDPSVELNSFADEDLVRRTWTMVFVAPGDCNASCQDTLFKMRQIRLSLGRRMERVHGLLLTSSSPTPEFSQTISEQHSGLTVLSTSDAPRIQNALTELFGNDVDTLNQFYIIDPLGNLMMMYQQDADPSDVMHDLKHLLKVSRVG